MIDENAKRAAVDSVFRDLRVRLICRRDAERCGKIADTTWACCGETLKAERVDVGDRELLAGACRVRLQHRDDYTDVVSFIPTWLLAVLIKVIISILVDFWISYENK